MRSEHDALLATIAARPDDDLPRLVYADWLEDRATAADVARAKFIRHQVARARTGFGSGPTQKEAAFLRIYGRVWQPGWRPEWHGLIEYERGFPCRLELDEARARAATGAAALVEPDRELRLLTELDVTESSYTGFALARLLADSGALPRMRRLTIHNATARADGLWARPELVNMTDLEVCFAWGAGIAGVAAASPRPGVRRLRATYPGPNPEDVVELLSGEAFPGVRDLELNVAGLDPAAVLASRLARPAHRLVLDWPSTARDGALDALAAGGGPPDLAELSLHMTMLIPGDRRYTDLARFVATLPAGRLRLLHVTGDNEEHARGSAAADALAAALVASPALHGLDHLDVSDHVFSPDLTVALIDAAAAAGVERLGVWLHDEPAFVGYLRDAPALDRFAWLRVSGRAAFAPVRARLAGRTTSWLTGHWFAGQRRWNPL